MSNRLLNLVKKLPAKPGIYLFFDKNKKLLYVGKATSLRNRVRSYFSGSSTGRPIEELIDKVNSIRHKATDSVLEAIILEAQYIKKYQPKYNVLGKDDKSWNYITISRDTYPQVNFIRQHDLDLWQKNKSSELKNIAVFFGPYPGLNAKATLKILKKIFFISECSPKQKRPCFYYNMGQCLGVCTGEITAADYKKKVITPLKNFLRGGKKRVIAGLARSMKAAAKDHNFEEAARLRDQIKSLKKIVDVALLDKTFFTDNLSDDNASVRRIEAYDISNMGDKEKVASMVVFDMSGPVKSDYRKFNIKSVSGQSDVDCLKEVLNRRLNHPEWPWPQVFLIDGGVPQVNAAKKVLTQHKKDAWLLGIAKGPKRNKNEFILSGKKPKFVAWVKENKNLLIQARDEAHRFAISFHKYKRGKSLNLS